MPSPLPPAGGRGGKGGSGGGGALYPELGTQLAAGLLGVQWDRISQHGARWATGLVGFTPSSSWYQTRSSAEFERRKRKVSAADACKIAKRAWWVVMGLARIPAGKSFVVNMTLQLEYASGPCWRVCCQSSAIPHDNPPRVLPGLANSESRKGDLWACVMRGPWKSKFPMHYTHPNITSARAWPELYPGH